MIRPAGERKGTEPGSESTLDPAFGMLIHSVMCYSVTDAKAPVYGNINQRFVLERAKRATLRRETWYWPESSYWIAFDTSVPLLLLPYLDARWSDMESMERIGVPSHLTFSSGWEWGYWLIDWSIARWSWRYTDNGRIQATGPLDSLRCLFPDDTMERLWREALNLQNQYLKDRELLKLLAGFTPFSELPLSIRTPFQPEPDFTYEWLLRRASLAEVAKVIDGPLAALDEYARRMESVCGQLEHESNRLFAGQDSKAAGKKVLAEELIRGLRITTLRARHRSLTLKALIAKREPRSSVFDSARLLAEAAAARGQALLLVRRQELVYRYPMELVAEKRKSRTAYGFGYLYPVRDLFFWRREEEQVRKERFDPFFMKLWDIRRIIGLESLLF